MEIIESYKKAGMIASAVREEGLKMSKPGVKLLDIAEHLENMIIKQGGRPAFPVNLSLNNIAAHYTPAKNDETIIKKDDILKIDVGVHVDGYIGDTACSVYFNDEHKKLADSTKQALNAAIELCTPERKLSELSDAIEETIRSFGFIPISNLTGHGLYQYNLHGDPRIMNVHTETDYKLKKGHVIAIEPFATTGSGHVKDSDIAMIYMLTKSAGARNPDAKMVLNFAAQFNGLPFAERWIPLSPLKTRLAIRELVSRRSLYEYPVLKDSQNVAQTEHTIMIDDTPFVLTL